MYKNCHLKIVSITNHQRNANENRNENITLYLSEWPSSVNQQTNVGKDVEKREPSYAVGGTSNWCSHYGKQYGGFLTK